MPRVAEPVVIGARGPAARQGLLRSGMVMTAGTAVSRLLGFVRLAVLASLVLGVANAAADAFALANAVPASLYLLVAGGVLNAVLVPQVVRASQRADGGAEYLDRLVTTAVLVLLAVTALATVAAPLLVTLATSATTLTGEGGALTGDDRALAVAFAYWCLPQVFFYGLYALLGQVLNARGSFGPYMWAPVVNNLVAIAGLLVFTGIVGDRAGGDVTTGDWTSGQVALLAGSATAGVAAQALVLLVPLRAAGVRLRPRLGLRGMGLRSAGRVAGWTLAALVVGQLAYYTMAGAAFSATAGVDRDAEPTAGLAVWGYAYLVFMLPHSLVAVSVVTALFTPMSAAAAAGQPAEVRRHVSTGLRTIGVASVVATAGLLVLAVPVSVLLTGSAARGGTVAPVLSAMALALVPFSAQYLLQRAHYAYEDARTPFLLACLSAAVWAAGTLVSSAVLESRDVLAGSALAMAVGIALSALTGAVVLRRRLGGLDGRRVLRTHVRLLVAGAVAYGLGLVVARATGAVGVDTRLEALVAAVACGSVVLGAYLLLLRVLRVEEVAPLLRRLPRRRGAAGRG